jgi:hypothetical protein
VVALIAVVFGVVLTSKLAPLGLALVGLGMLGIWSSSRSPAPKGITVTDLEVRLEHGGPLKRELQALLRDQWIDLWLERPSSNLAKVYLNVHSGPGASGAWIFTLPLYWGEPTQVEEFLNEANKLLRLQTLPAILVNEEPSWAHVMQVLRDNVRLANAGETRLEDRRAEARNVLMLNNVAASFMGRSGVEAWIFDAVRRQLIHRRPAVPDATYAPDAVAEVTFETVSEGKYYTAADDCSYYQYRYEVWLVLHSGERFRLQICISDETRRTRTSAAIQQVDWLVRHSNQLLAEAEGRPTKPA